MGSDEHQITIGDVAKIKHGFAFKGEFFTEDAQPSVLVTPGNFSVGGGFQIGKQKFYEGPVPADYVLSEGDLVVTMTDLSKASDTLGYAAKVPATPGITYLHNQRVGLVQMKSEERVRRDWLHYLMRTEQYRSWILGSASGTTVKHTSPSRIESFSFIPPSVQDQAAVAEFLDTVELQITNLRQTNATLEAIAQALFKSWFVDFDPVRAKAEGREPEGMDAATAALFPSEFEDSELGPIPKGWQVEQIGKLVSCLGGATPSTKDESFWQEGIHHWATPKDLSGLQSPVLVDTDRRITDSGLSKISSGLLPAGTLLLSSRAPIGYLAISAVPTAINQGFIAMPAGGYLSPGFLLCWCNENMGFIKQNANGSTFMEISKKAFRPLPVCVPTVTIRDVFHQLTDPIFNRIETNERRSRTLTEFRDVLLPRLISGRLRLPLSDERVENMEEASEYEVSA